MRPLQPMPATITTFSGSSSRPRIASMRARVMVPLEQPGHQIVLGVRSQGTISLVLCGVIRGSL